MKLKLLSSIALFIGVFIGMVQAQTYSPPWNNPMVAYLVVYTSEGGGVVWDGPESSEVTGQYTLNELGTYTTDFITFDFLPETNKFVLNQTFGGETNYYRNASETDGSKYLDCLTFWERTIIGTESNVVMDFVINSNTLDTNRYDVIAFVKHVVPGSGASEAITELNIGNVTGTFQVDLAADYSVWSGDFIQAGFRISGTNASPTAAAALGAMNVTVTNLFLLAPDPIPPTPDPMSFAVAPYTVSDNKVGMVAATAEDISGVEYQFQRLTGGVQVYTSSVPEIVIDGLSPNTAYSFRVRAVDLSSSANATAYSGIFPVSTLPTDIDTPTPNPAEIASSSASSQSIKLTANTATDPAGSAVEYYFDCIAGDGVDSGWIATNVYVNTALASSTDYTWTVQVRDLSAATNTTLASDPLLVTTADYPIAAALTNDLKGYTGTNNDGETVHDVLSDDLEFADYLPTDRRILFDGAGANFGTFGGGDFGRNIIRTLGNTYADQDFEAYVTVSGWTPQTVGGVSTNGGHIFIGFGPGDIGAFGVPDWNYINGNTNASFICEVTGEAANIWSQTNNSISNIVEDATVALLFNEGQEQRIKLVFDFAAQEGTLIIDQSYDGVTFNPEVTLGPVTVPDFSTSQSKVYLGADDGVILSDFEIIGGGSPVLPVIDLSIVSSDGSTAVLQWTSVSGQTYDIVYKTDLSSGTWTVDPANDNIPGTGGVLSPSSTVAGDNVFYQVTTE